MDNKYQTPPPYGKSGLITLSEQDIGRQAPIFLIDGWLLSDGRVTDEPTYIGEFSNLQRGDASVSPHGRASYQMTLRYVGVPRIVSVDFPWLASRYEISLDGRGISQGLGNGRITFLLTSGDHLLTVETLSELGYYSGMYFPPCAGHRRNHPADEQYPKFCLCPCFSCPLGVGGIHVFSVADRGKVKPLVWDSLRLLCPLYVPLFCVSFFHGFCAILVLRADCGIVLPVLLCGAAYRSGIRLSEGQSLEMDTPGVIFAAAASAGSVPADSGYTLGSSCPWQTDRFLLYVYLLLFGIFCLAGNQGAKL